MACTSTRFGIWLILRADAAQDVERRVGRLLPCEPRRTSLARLAQLASQALVRQQLFEPGRNVIDVFRVDLDRGSTRQLGQRARTPYHGRYAVSHRLQKVQTEALVKARKGERRGGCG